MTAEYWLELSVTWTD